MKRLNRKGFTLIELLAVIVILAIVMVVTIPSVINAMNSAREGQLKNSADTVAEWLTKNYELYSFDTKAADTSYDATLAGSWVVVNGDNTTYPAVNVASYLTSAGMKDATGVTSALAQLQGSKICVTITVDNNSSFYVTGGTNVATSTGCTAVTSS